MAFAKTLDELLSKGYEFKDHAECRGCGDAIEWWRTPLGKNIPMNPMQKGSDAAVPHWTSCTEADSFRSSKS